MCQPAQCCAHCDIWASAGPGQSSSSPYFVSPKQWKLDGRFKIYNSVRARSPLMRSKKKINIECAAILKHMCQCRGAADSFQTHLNHYAIGSYQSPEKNCTWLIVFRHQQPSTGLSIFLSSWISRPDTKYKNSWTQTFGRYILSHSTWIWVEIFSRCTIFVQCSLSSSLTLRTDNLKFRKDILDQFVDSWSITQ